MIKIQHPRTRNEISNEMLAFQANFVSGPGVDKTRSVSGRPHEEGGAFRMRVRVILRYDKREENCGGYTKQQ